MRQFGWPRRRCAGLGAVLVGALLAAAAARAQPAMTCDAASFEKLGLAKTRIVSASAVKDDARAGPHCVLRGAVNERTGSDGKAVCDRLRDAVARALERPLLRPGERRQRRRGRARVRRPRRQSARQRARARLRGIELRLRSRRPGEPRRGPRRRQPVRLRRAGAPRLRLYRQRHAHAARENHHRALLRPPARVFVHGRLLERRPARDGRRDAANARVRRLPRRRPGLQPAAGRSAARLGHPELRRDRRTTRGTRSRATT